VPPAATPAPSPSTSVTPSVAAGRRDVLVGVLVIAAAVAVGVWMWTRPVASLPRPPTGAVLLDRTLTLTGKAGESLRLRIAKPCMLAVAAETPAGGLVVSFGPEQPVETTPRDAPDPALSSRWTAAPGGDTHEVAAFGPGMYVLRFDAGSTQAVRTTVHVRVVERPWRSGPADGEPVR
jgi:hypothetical protein